MRWAVEACRPVVADSSFSVTGSGWAASASSRRMARSMTWMAMGDWPGACSLSEPGAIADMVEVMEDRRAVTCRPPRAATDAAAHHGATSRIVKSCRRFGKPARKAGPSPRRALGRQAPAQARHFRLQEGQGLRSEEHTSELQSRENLVCRRL